MVPGPPEAARWYLMKILRKNTSMQMTHATMIMAAKRWIMPAFSIPPMTPIHVCAQALSLYLSGMPVSTRVEKLIMMKKCTQRWNGVKRRKWVRAPATTCAALASGSSGHPLVTDGACQCLPRRYIPSLRPR